MICKRGLSKGSLLQSSGNASRFEDHIDSKKEHGKTESRSSSVVKKMINAFEETCNKSSTSGASMSSTDRTQTGLVAGT